MSINFQRGASLLVGFLFGVLLLAGCSFGDGETPIPNPTGDEVPIASPEVTPTQTTIPTPTVPPRVLNICLGSEPETLYLYGGSSLSQSHIFEAIYDGPIDVVGYNYHPVILENLPGLADGDASLDPVPVQTGDWMVNDAGQLVQLDLGEIVRPFGCSDSSCAVVYGGEPLEMAQLSATFTLKEGIKWSDSVPLTAADSAFSYQIASECQADFGPCGGLGLVSEGGLDTLLHTASYSAQDERSVRWVGVPGFLDPAYQTNFFIPLPEHQLSKYEIEDLFTAQEAAQRPLGWGPYVINDWVPGGHISLHKNPLYFRMGEVEPQFDQLIFHFVGVDGEVNLAALADGTCDVLDQEASLSFLEAGLESLKQLDENGELQVHISTSPAWEHADFGIRPVSYDDGYQPGEDRPDFFADVRTRQAFAMCMDRNKIIQSVLFGESTVQNSYLPVDHPLYNPDLSGYEFDPVAAAQLLDQVGWVDLDGDIVTPRVARGIQGIFDGTPLVLTFTTSNAPQRQRSSQILAESLAQCGIQVELQYGEASEIFAPGPEGTVFGRRFDLTQFAWDSGVHPHCELWTTEQIPGDPILEDENGVFRFPYGWGGANQTGFSSLDYDRACRMAEETLPGQPGFLENQHNAQAIFAEQLPVVPLYQRLKLALTRTDMCGFELDPSAFSEMWNIEAFDFGPNCPIGD